MNLDKKDSSMKIGILGGSFNPAHYAHLVCAESAKAALNLKKIYILPNYQNPLKALDEKKSSYLPALKHRIQLLKYLFDFSREDYKLDLQEAEQPVLSYTLNTLQNFIEDKRYFPENIYLIIGLDNLYQLHKWHQFEKIFEKCHLAVISRPHFAWPKRISDLPLPLQKCIKSLHSQHIEWYSGKRAEFIKIEDIDISSTKVRKKFFLESSTHKYLNVQMIQYIQTEQLYLPETETRSKQAEMQFETQAEILLEKQQPKTPSKKLALDYKDLSFFCCRQLEKHKAISTRGFDLSDRTYPFEFSLISSGFNTRHTLALAEKIQQQVQIQFNLKASSTEGLKQGQWVLIDYGNLLVHIFYEPVRYHYNLEELWKGAPCFYPPSPEKSSPEKSSPEKASPEKA